MPDYLFDEEKVTQGVKRLENLFLKDSMHIEGKNLIIQPWIKKIGFALPLKNLNCLIFQIHIYQRPKH